MMKISIAFPIFNGLNYTKQCLTNLFDEHKIESLDAEYSVVIVDDNSSDGSRDWIQKNYPQVSLLKGTGDLWWGGGINKAVRYALDELKADYILWWNNDVIADENYFGNLLNILKTIDNDIILGSKVYLYQDNDVVWSMGGIFNIKTGFKTMIGFNEKDCEKFSKPVYCDWLTGMGTVTHKSVYDTIGMVDEQNFPQYHGDSDFTLRAKKTGYKIMVHPDLKIYNDTSNTGLKHNESFKGLYNSLVSIRSNYNIKKDLLFYKKHTTSILSRKILLEKYLRYIGGFFKWKIYGAIGLKKH